MDTIYIFVIIYHQIIVFLQYTLDGNLVETWTTSSTPNLENKKLTIRPNGIDIYQNHIYIVDKSQLRIINLKKELISHWPLLASGLGVKVDLDYVYITKTGHHQIFVYSKMGNLIKNYGKELSGHDDGEFSQPGGLALDNHFLYICDLNNHRIQALKKGDGTYSHQWGSKGTMDGLFDHPYSIYLSDGLVYIGDVRRIQLFTTYGIFIQKLGDIHEDYINGKFYCIHGLVVVKDQLYVSDSGNQRIQVFGS